MELAKISANGQITVPVEIRRQLGLHPGDKILFFENSSGDIVIKNASIAAIQEAQAAACVAKELGINDEEDVQKIADDMRHEGKKNVNTGSHQ